MSNKLVTKKIVYERVKGTQLIVRSHKSKTHKPTALEWQDARYRMTDPDYYVVLVDRVGVFLEHVH